MIIFSILHDDEKGAAEAEGEDRRSRAIPSRSNTFSGRGHGFRGETAQTRRSVRHELYDEVSVRRSGLAEASTFEETCRGVADKGGAQASDQTEDRGR